MMSKIIEIPDIAQWEENDSELAKKNIIELSSNIKYHIDFNKKLIDEITRLNMIIDIKNKRIDELNKRLDKKNNRIDKSIEYIKTFIEIDEETGTYSMPYTFDAYNLYKLLKKLEGEDNG